MSARVDAVRGWLVVLICLMLPIARLAAAATPSTSSVPAPTTLPARLTATTAASLELKVGIVAYFDPKKPLSDIRGVFDKLRESWGRPFNVRYAVGSNVEVASWVERGLVDIAVLPPGGFTAVWRTPSDDSPRCRYLATRTLGPFHAPWASDDRKVDGRTGFTFKSVCLVRKDSTIADVEDLKARALKGQIQFVFVDELSIAGTIVPRIALEEMGIPTGHSEYSGLHTESLRRLYNNKVEGRERVAFVWDDTPSPVPNTLPQDYFKHVPFPALEAHDIPQSTWVTRLDFPADLQRELQRELFKQTRRLAGLEHEVQDFYDRSFECDDIAARVRGWIAKVQHDKSPDAGLTSLRSIVWELQRYPATHDKRQPRLAVVLSGGARNAPTRWASCARWSWNSNAPR